MFLQIVLVLASLYVVAKLYFKLTLGRCKSPTSLIGKTVLITGGNSGMGFQTALALAGRGCRLIIADKDNCQTSKEKIIQETGNTNIVIKQFDLTSLNSVRKLAKDINDTEERLDILINNAGTASLGHTFTEDGLHILMQVNHFGPFLLTHLLVELLKKSAPSRIIFVSSLAVYFNYLTTKNLNSAIPLHSNILTEFFLYGNTKLCTTIAARGFAKKLQGTGVTSNSLHPGVVQTPFLEKISYGVGFNKLHKQITYLFVRYIYGMFAKDAEEGVQTALHLALAKELKNVTGEFFMDCKPFRIPGAALDPNFSSKIWEASENYVKLSPDEKL